MNYDEFNAEYTEVLDRIKSGDSDPADLSDQVERLRAATEGIQEPAEREQVDSNLAALTDLLELSTRDSDREDIWEISAEIVRRAGSSEGSVPDRLTLIESSIGELNSLAERNPDEREALMQSVDTLRLLQASLQSSLVIDPDASDDDTQNDDTQDEGTQDGAGQDESQPLDAADETQNGVHEGVRDDAQDESRPAEDATPR